MSMTGSFPRICEETIEEECPECEQDEDDAAASKVDGAVEHASEALSNAADTAKDVANTFLSNFNEAAINASEMFFNARENAVKNFPLYTGSDSEESIPSDCDTDTVHPTYEAATEKQKLSLMYTYPKIHNHVTDLYDMRRQFRVSLERKKDMRMIQQSLEGWEDDMIAQLLFNISTQSPQVYAGLLERVNQRVQFTVEHELGDEYHFNPFIRRDFLEHYNECGETRMKFYDPKIWRDPMAFFHLLLHEVKSHKKTIPIKRIIGLWDNVTGLYMPLLERFSDIPILGFWPRVFLNWTSAMEKLLKK
ncbi:CLUMA_CG006076, isoform A [Clunio marinus]|uniref:CLUMA_CG006076, isoform A n=1 Tax=Clunio marinus TaxID=568069 RepID=A0A1J1HWX1_9DIPT|nr:CLUMA_CG006076, isoform A [Clunio marinus]